MKFTVTEMMKNAFVLVSDKSANDYDRFCKRMRHAGFDTMPYPFSYDIPYCLVPADIHKHCTLNHYFLVKTAKAMGLDHVTVFELDAYPMKDCRNELAKMFKDTEIPDDADIVTFGNLMWIRNGDNRLVGATDTCPYGHIRGRQWGSHAVVYFKQGYDRYISNFLAISKGVRCNADHWWQFTPNMYHAYRSFFMQAKDNIQHLGWCSDRENFADFPGIKESVT